MAVTLVMAIASWLPWLPLVVDDMLTSPAVLRMTHVQRAVYVWLLMYQWRDGKLPADHESLAAMAGMKPEQFAEVAPQVMQNFNLRRGHYRNKKLAVLRIQAEQGTLSLSTRGQKGGQAKAKKFNEMRTTAMARARAPASTSISESSPGLGSKPPNQEKTSSRARENLRSAEPKNGNGAHAFDQGPGWLRFRAEYPCIPNEDFACQMWLSIITTADEEAAQWAGLDAYRKSQRSKDGVWYEAHNWLRDRRYRGKFPPATDSGDNELQRLRRL